MSEKVKRILGPHGRKLKPEGFIGFSNFPDQFVNKVSSRGFTFNLLLLGESGLGKSTLVDSLFQTNFTLVKEKKYASKLDERVKCSFQSFQLVENNVTLRLTLIYSEGFGEQINREKDAAPIVEYITKQFDLFLTNELQLKRKPWKKILDTRIHACLYFISPTGHSLKSIDVVVLKELESRVNLIPIISKADTISKNELYLFKAKILQEIQENQIHIYQFPTNDCDISELNKGLSSLQPFAVVASRREFLIHGKIVRARKYLWGMVEVENEAHNDFVWLREMLIKTNMYDLIETTHNHAYELHRKQRLAQMGYDDVDFDGKIITLTGTVEQKKKAQIEEMRQIENEMTKIFIEKVKSKELELCSRQDQITSLYQSKKLNLEEEIQEVEKKMHALQAQIQDFKSDQEKKGSSKKKLSIFSSK